MPQNCEVLRTMADPVSHPILIHDDVQTPVQAVVSRPEELPLRPLVEQCVRLSPLTRLPSGERADGAVPPVCEETGVLPRYSFEENTCPWGVSRHLGG